MALLETAISLVTDETTDEHKLFYANEELFVVAFTCGGISEDGLQPSLHYCLVIRSTTVSRKYRHEAGLP